MIQIWYNDPNKMSGEKKKKGNVDASRLEELSHIAFLPWKLSGFCNSVKTHVEWTEFSSVLKTHS